MTSSIPQTRWLTKKLARKTVAISSWLTGSLAASIATDSKPAIRVLTYHRFGESLRDPFCVSTDEFAKQMEFLAEQNAAVSLADLDRYLKGQTTLQNSSVVVTIDDGFRSLYAEALPVLKDFQIPAVAFITPGLLGRRDMSTDPEPYLTWEELSEIADSGMTIGSHAWSHRSLGDLTAEEIRMEAVLSRESLEHHLQRPVDSFAYPFGTRADFNKMTADILKNNGYSCAFTSQHGTIGEGLDPYALPRIKVEGGEGLWLFRLLLRGGLDAWRFVDHTLWKIQARRHEY
jgi:peptidoglycan/xylan/chitin deacetylase (PgdA/CDA1 family)